MILVLFQYCFHVGHDYLVATGVFSVMTAQAQFRRLHGQLVGIIRNMGIVAGKTQFVGFKSCVLYLNLANMLLHVIMTGEAKFPSAISRKVVLKWTAMRVVTLDASVLYRWMHMFFFLKSILLVIMAEEADIIALGHKKLREIAFVGAVADTAATIRHRSMDIFFPSQLTVMTDKA